MVKLSAWLAIAVGVVVAAAQLFRNWDNWAHWPSWMIDEVAAVVMITAGLLALRRQTTRLLPVGWAFACGLYVSAVIGHVSVLSSVAEGELYASELRLVVILCGLLGLSLAGLALVLLARRPS